MRVTANPYRNTTEVPALPADVPYPSTDAGAVRRLLEQCPTNAPTPLVAATDLAATAGIATLWVKDERGRMGLGSFKALGAAYVIAHDAVDRAPDALPTALAGTTYVTASAGNHGMSVAAGARLFGAQAVVYISDTVPESFAERLRDKGALVVREGADYEASMQAALRAASDNGWVLSSDSSWPGYYTRPHRLMEGYLALMDEVAQQVTAAPTHIFLQAGVGGLAGACAAFARVLWGDTPTIIVVEPDAAPALIASIQAGQAVVTQGPVSSMGRLDCKEPSLIALKGLARDADFFVTISEDEAAEVLPILATADLETTPSGGAGLAALLTGEARDQLGLSDTSRVLAVLSEGPE